MELRHFGKALQVSHPSIFSQSLILGLRSSNKSQVGFLYYSTVTAYSRTSFQGTFILRDVKIDVVNFVVVPSEAKVKSPEQFNFL
ncbi:hypothetical protein GRAN_0034 [Granulicella sibirica]|uniref:Uncharacterized protein n=1 Tax=Granulicella sibirica TaxID=2479048 RepID=A0A4V1L5R9_9BACT|nr:hypothetical protein GRAN_0034 [Granulicella sibirica]